MCGCHLQHKLAHTDHCTNDGACECYPLSRWECSCVATCFIRTRCVSVPIVTTTEHSWCYYFRLMHYLLINYTSVIKTTFGLPGWLQDSRQCSKKYLEWWVKELHSYSNLSKSMIHLTRRNNNVNLCIRMTQNWSIKMLETKQFALLINLKGSDSQTKAVTKVVFHYQSIS